MNMTHEIDIHGMTKAQAKRHLERYLSDAPPEVGELTVIHGYSSPTLRDMVRKELKHYRIQRRILSLNDGITILLLQPKQPKQS